MSDRRRLAQDLHDTLLQGFLSASMQLDLAIDDLPENSATRITLSRVLRLMREVLDEGRDVLQGFRLARFEGFALEQVFSRLAQELFIPKSTDFRLIVKGTPRPLRPRIREEVIQIGREALANAFRHSQARNVRLEIEYGIEQVRVFIKDDGCGIDPDVLEAGLEGHWGIPGMRDRTGIIEAHLEVRSRIAAGTEVALTIPNRIAVLAQPSHPGRKTCDTFSRAS